MSLFLSGSLIYIVCIDIPESEDQPPTVTSLKKKITQSLSIDESDTADTNVSEQKEEHTANTAFKG